MVSGVSQFPEKRTDLFLHADHLGAVVKASDAGQNLVWDVERRPFGERSPNVAAIEMPLGFPGQYFDEETGNYYNYFRDYDPSTGRYLQSDPIGLDGGLNTYGYVLQNPINYLDYYGLATTVDDWCRAHLAACSELENVLPGTTRPIPVPVPPVYWDEEAETESCPSSDPDDWEKIPHSRPPAYRPKGEKEPVFQGDRSGDRSHGGSKWKKWDKYRDWVNGKPRNGTYDENGRRLRD